MGRMVVANWWLTRCRSWLAWLAGNPDTNNFWLPLRTRRLRDIGRNVIVQDGVSTMGCPRWGVHDGVSTMGCPRWGASYQFSPNFRKPCISPGSSALRFALPLKWAGSTRCPARQPYSWRGSRFPKGHVCPLNISDQGRPRAIACCGLSPAVSVDS